MANTDDLRYVRTETTIRDAFMELVSEQPVDTITASAVCRRAGISRNAFYLHHSGVAALYAAMFDELLEDVKTECLASSARVVSTGNADKSFSSAVLGALAKHEKMLRALLPADDGTLAARLAEGVENAYAESSFVFGERGDSWEYRLWGSFGAWAYVGVVRRWVLGCNRPLSDFLPQFETMQSGLIEASTRFLTGKDESEPIISSFNKS